MVDGRRLWRSYHYAHHSHPIRPAKANLEGETLECHVVTDGVSADSGYRICLHT